MINWFLSPNENRVVALSLKDNSEELINWKLPNVMFPMLVIAFSLLVHPLFAKQVSLLSFLNLLVNGSIAMAAFNRMSSVVLYFARVEFDLNNARALGINMRNIRTKIMSYSFFLILIIATLYSFQVSRYPFSCSIWIPLNFFGSLLLFIFSTNVSKVTFLLQEAFLNNTYLLSVQRQQLLINEIPEQNDIRF